MSGGSLPPSAARAAWSLANGDGKKSEFFPSPLEHLALIVRAILHLEGCGNRRRLRFGETGSARFGQIAERKELEAVAVRTDLLIDLIAALQLRLVINPQRTPE